MQKREYEKVYFFFYCFDLSELLMPVTFNLIFLFDVWLYNIGRSPSLDGNI